jgi:hypothetical protein
MAESRREFFKALTGRDAIRNLGSLFGGARLLSHLTDGGNPEDAGLLLGRRLAAASEDFAFPGVGQGAAMDSNDDTVDAGRGEGDCQRATGGDEGETPANP